MHEAVDVDILGADALSQHREELLSVYRDAYSDKIGSPFFSEARHWERLKAYAEREGFGLVEARHDGELIGYALGYRLPTGSGWWRGLREEVDPDLIAEDGTRTFALTYMMVRQQYRRRGHARAMHDALLGNRPEARATLLVLPDNQAAQAAYRSWGWHKVGTIRPYMDAPVYDAMLLDSLAHHLGRAPGRPAATSCRRSQHTRFC